MPPAIQPVPIHRESNERGEHENFYVPHFLIKISNRNLPQDVVRDVMDVSYTDKIDEIDSFEFTVNNWDAAQLTFKYEPAAQPANPQAPNLAGLFDPGQQIEIWMGYVHNLRQMLVGEITTLSPNYPESGHPTLKVSGKNILHALRKSQHTYAWENKSDSWIAQWLGNQSTSDRRPGLGIPVDVPNIANEAPVEFVFMNNQYDILFLLERARRRNYVLSLEVDGENRRPLRLRFGPSETVRDVTYELEWGKTLVSFSPTLTTANQIEQVTVRGWDRRAKRPIEGTARLGDRNACAVNSDLQTAVARAVHGRHEVITHIPVRNQREATDRAKSILCGQLQEMVTASAVTIGLPDVRSGRRVRIKKIAPRFDGDYYITETTHIINDSGYRTTLNARRESPIPAA